MSVENPPLGLGTCNSSFLPPSWTLRTRARDQDVWALSSDLIVKSMSPGPGGKADVEFKGHLEGQELSRFS